MAVYVIYLNLSTVLVINLRSVRHTHEINHDHLVIFHQYNP